jgi:hypothetical protein
MVGLALLACHRDDVTLGGDPVDDPTAPTVLSTTPCDACGGDCELDELAYGPAVHETDPIDYVDRPPAGGPHDPCWATWGVHEEPVPDDNFVHNLEHGGVVYLYACDDCAADADALATLATDEGQFALVTPYPDMDARFAALAWGWRLTTGCVDVDLFGQFYVDHVNQAPESLPSDPPSSCP